MKNKNLIIDIILLIEFVIISFNSFALLILTKRGGLELFGMGRAEWVFLHNISGIVFIITILVHILLHWKYLKVVLWKK